MDAFFSASSGGEVGDVEGGAHAGEGGIDGGGMVLNGANVTGHLGGIGGEGVAGADAAAGEGAGDDGADSFWGKDAVNGEAGLADVAWGRGVFEGGSDGVFEFVHALSGVGGDGDDGGVFEGGSLEVVAEDFGGEVEVFGEVGFGEGDDEVGDAKVGENLKVFLGLGHPGVVGGDDEEGEVEGGDAGDHVVDEVGVAGDINDADLVGVIPFCREAEVGEAELDGDAAFLFLGESVGVNAGEGFDEGGFAVIDVTGGSEDEVHALEIRGKGGDARRCL